MQYHSEIETIWPTRKKDVNDITMTLKEINDMPIEKILFLDNFHSVEAVEQRGNKAWKIILKAEKVPDADTWTLFDRVFPTEHCVVYMWRKEQEPPKLIHTLN